MNVCAFGRANPFGAQLNAIYSSDIGHFDVIDMRDPLREAWELVEDGLITEANFRDFTFANAVRLWGTQNPHFFEGTVVAAKPPQSSPSRRSAPPRSSLKAGRAGRSLVRAPSPTLRCPAAPAMASIRIRDLDETVKRKLRLRAQRVASAADSGLNAGEIALGGGEGPSRTNVPCPSSREDGRSSSSITPGRKGDCVAATQGAKLKLLTPRHPAR
jgi:hypothetical protein